MLRIDAKLFGLFEQLLFLTAVLNLVLFESRASLVRVFVCAKHDARLDMD